MLLNQQLCRAGTADELLALFGAAPSVSRVNTCTAFFVLSKACPFLARCKVKCCCLLRTVMTSEDTVRGTRAAVACPGSAARRLDASQ